MEAQAGTKTFYNLEQKYNLHNLCAGAKLIVLNIGKRRIHRYLREVEMLNFCYVPDTSTCSSKGIYVVAS
jgi:hypothetical protein